MLQRCSRGTPPSPGPKPSPGPAGPELRGASAAGDGTAARHDGPEVDLGEALARLGHGVEHRGRGLLDRGLLEVGRVLLVVRGLRRGLGARDVDLLGRSQRPLGAAAAAPEDLDDLEGSVTREAYAWFVA